MPFCKDIKLYVRNNSAQFTKYSGFEIYQMYQIGTDEYNGYIKIRIGDLDRLNDPLELLKKRKIMMYFDRKVDYYDFIEHPTVMLRKDEKFVLDLADYNCTTIAEFATYIGSFPNAVKRYFDFVYNGVGYKKLEITD
jgi:hypothetical protein